MNIFYNFICFIEKSYHCKKYNPCHNSMHATEVMMSMMIFLSLLDESTCEMISNLQIFTAFISSIIHDVDHPENNNAFEINTQSDLSLLSILYNDQSILEYHHLQYIFNELEWEEQTKKEFRKQRIDSVLATDLSISYIKQLKVLRESHLEYVFKSTIKMSHLSHVTKPLNQHKKWTNSITNKFHNQGDKEIACMLDVTPLCNRIY